LRTFVLDASTALAWCLPDERHPLAEHARRWAVGGFALAPGIFWYELRNVLLVSERRERIEREDTRAALYALAHMDIQLDTNHDEPLLLDLARSYRLGTYDAAYLEVAMRRGLPLASLDRRLSEAAAACGVDPLSVSETGATEP